MAKQALFSNELDKITYDEAPPKIQGVVDELNINIPDCNTRIKENSDSDSYFICLNVNVQLPTRGPVNDIDIREVEPICIEILPEFYPFKAPSVYSDRRDFPSNELPHLNPVATGTPPNLCLHRGNIDDWFAENSITHLIKRTQNWLRDAARNRLIREEDNFEFTRHTETRTVGYIIFEETDLIEWYNKMLSISDNKKGFGFSRYYLISGKDDPAIGKDAYSLNAFKKNTGFRENIYFPGIVEGSIRYNQSTEAKKDFIFFIFGLLIHPHKDKIYDKYFAEIPNTYSDFIEWGKSLDLQIKESIEAYIEQGLLLFNGIPITIYLPRPQRVINYKTNIEILNFVINIAKFGLKDGKPHPESPVYFLESREPLTTDLAKRISGYEKDNNLGKILQIGCGALGSKITLHLAKSGQNEFILVDNDTISPHNLIRHGLLTESIGKSKALALEDEIRNLFYSEELKTKSLKKSGFNIEDSIFSEANILLDCTASESFQNYLVKKQLPDNLRYCRFEIFQNGKIGLLRIEGDHRNPRMDDLQTYFFDAALEDKNLSTWLSEEKRDRKKIGSIREEIFIGLSCSSDTMEVSDETISIHSSIFSSALRNYNNISNGKGFIHYTSINNGHILSVNTDTINVSPTLSYNFINEESWEVRFKFNIKEELIARLRKNKPDETGGILIGRINNRFKTIYVTRYMPPPEDSVKSPYAFVRGVENVIPEINKIRNKTGNTLDYVGEWHTHPGGSPKLSEQDHDTVGILTDLLDKVPYPTFITIVTEEDLHPYIFGKYI